MDPLRAAYEDVTPLRDSGRLELDTPVRHRARVRGAEPLVGGMSKSAIDPCALPSDIDPSDSGALFRHAMRGAQPIDTRNRAELVRPGPAPAPIKREADERAALNESLLAPLSFEDRLDMGDEAAFLRTGLPRRVLSDLRRGRWILQGQIDLHGLTRDEARDALGHFLTASLQLGRRCIRVIHGKGLGSPGKVSILKQLSRGWLAQREEILAFCQAGPHDGGSGALLVLMRAQNVSRD
jgi:DNA-nicking Smr family endonuclease